MPEDPEDLVDARVWSACTQLALDSDEIARGVLATCVRQRELLAACLSAAAVDATAERVDAVHALVDGLTRRMLVDPEFTHERATASLRTTVSAWTAG